MKRKIFISINIPEKDKKRLVKITEKWPDLPIKWVKEQNLHITLSFLGFVDDETLEDICQKVCSAAENINYFDIEFEKIEIGPTQEEPRLIWLIGTANENLRQLQEAVEKNLGIFVKKKKTFRPHITLGKIRARKWEDLSPKPEISEKFNLLIQVESADVMASDFENEGQEYTVIKSCSLK